MSPIGMLIAKSQGQVAMERIPEANVGPATEETATTVAFTPIPRPKCRRGYIRRISVVLTLVMAAAPNPWQTRAVTSVARESDNVQPSEATMKIPSPPM